MKRIISKNKKNHKKLRQYWQLIEPNEYVDALLSKSKEWNLTKLAIKKVKKEELVGTLKQGDDGFVYIDISNNIIHGLFPLVDDEDAEEPPYFGKGNIGAHISAISDEEIKDIEIKEIGEKIPFEIIGVYSANPDGWDDMSKVWFINVDCPKLKKIRRKYDLPETYKDKKHDFHITFSVKKKKKKTGKKK